MLGVAMRHVVFEPGRITLNRIMGEVFMYLLLGVTWAILFDFVRRLIRSWARQHHYVYLVVA